MFVLTRFAEGQFSSSTFLIRIRRVTNPKGSIVFVHKRAVLLGLWGLAVLSTILAIRFGHFFATPAAQLGLGLALGGATSNLWDMLQRHGVIDFIDMRLWPVFNLADVAIFIGSAVALWFAF